jgi:hypothetical protein
MTAKQLCSLAMLSAVGIVAYVTYDNFRVRKRLHEGVNIDMQRIKQKLADRGFN